MKSNIQHTCKCIRRNLINKKTHGFRCHDSAVYTESGKHITPLTLTRGEIVWHTKYNEPYIFLFIDNGVPKFADTEGRFYEHLNDTYRLTRATPEQEAMFWRQLAKNGFKYEQKKIKPIK